MKITIRMIAVAAMLAGGLSAAIAQQDDGASGGNLNSNGDLAGKSYKGSPGGAKTSPITSSADDGGLSGLENTNGDLAGIATTPSARIR